MNGDPEVAVLFVCFGNTCRSPLAEGILRARLSEAGLGGRVAVDSAGTNPAEVGAPPDQRAVLVAERHGIDISQGRVRAFAARDFDRFDRIVVVDRRNHDLLLAQAGDDRDRLKLRLLRGEDGDVADPVFGTEEHYERAFAQIDEACDRLLEEVRASLSES